ncbi:T9SS type A sorting domain-containing protein [Algibacter pectinivorans]|uniref:Por secretion system C-terminal sorting domain-containing protein n=1 Tax=Algibacter pectinivorans TaxID=870482 RepID=A0A1I1R3S1_9FLAO|nr:T9SS type A sorting domain-containing protein [Algibacter pectinivorans]SFD24920.1 Por secretion system C-terminal sorting domain-containing protein [Algibacter pectinivorans]
MTFKLTLLLLFAANLIFSQDPDLYVDDNSYLYAKDIVVFVNNDIRLETPTSNLFFRGDAQLVQNNDVKNSDAGALSIFQNQTAGVYEYNYFCSPVGAPVDGITKTNVPFNGSTIYDPADETDVENVTSTPYNFIPAYESTATALSSHWMYTIRDGEGYWNWTQILNTGDAETGYGFSLKGSPNTNNMLDFRGRPNNGTITVSCSFDGTDDQPSGTPNKVVTLTGNPYPSALDLKLFFVNSASNQTNLDGELFFWEQLVTGSHYLAEYEGGYATYAPGNLSDPTDNGTYISAAFKTYNDSDGSDNTTTTTSTVDYSANNQRRYAAVGQGFVIQSDVNGGFATFDNSMRVYYPEDATDGSIFAKSSVKKNKDTSIAQVIPMSHNGVDYKSIFENPTIIPEIKLHSHINKTFYKENVIAFREGTPNNEVFNKFFDAQNINDFRDDVYLYSSDKELVLKSIKYNENTRLPLGIKTAKSNTVINITVHELKDVPKDVNIYIYDNETDTYTDIVNNTFNIILDKGVFNDRFEVTFTKNNASLSTTENSIDDFMVFQNNTISEISLVNPNSLDIKSFTLYDVAGKQVMQHVISSNSAKLSYSTKALSDGVYVAKINLNDHQVFSKKIIVSNKN